MRRAFTLIEMIIAISVGAALTGIAVSLLLVLYRAEQNGRAHVAQAQSLQQLADQFRRDVHAAADVTVNGKEPQGWQFDLTEKRVVQYTVGAEGISREERIESKDVRRESYVLPKGSMAAVTVDRATNPPVVTLTIEPKDDSLRPGRTFRVEAVAGRDLRFTQARKETK
jgi:prepilin-type N-terminal cleavage/methylation domain-containing protein